MGRSPRRSRAGAHRGRRGRARWSAYWLLPLMLALVLGAAVLDGESGVWSWVSLRADLGLSQQRLAALGLENEALRREARALREDPFRIERAIREDLGLVKPGEVVVLFTSDARVAKPADSEGGAEE